MKANRDFQVQKKWKFLDNTCPVFSSEKIHPEIAKLLSHKGIKSETEALKYLYPDYNELSDPYLLKDMEEAVDKITSVLDKKGKIAIYGDYDVDGITATAILIKFFTLIGADVISYIPKRSEEGYGLNSGALDELSKKKVELIITVDCGTASLDEVLYAKKQGMDIIITDHHSIKNIEGQECLPDALVINPKRSKSHEAYYNLCGAGVAYYLVRAFVKKKPGIIPLEYEKWWLDLVSLGTICDVVPLVKDNRILAKFGLKVLSKSRNVGLNALARVSEMNLSDVDSYKVGFVLGPRLNAAGRLETANSSLDLLLEEETIKAITLANELNTINIMRQEVTEKIVNEARDIILKEGLAQKRKILLLQSKEWPAGVVGIAASRLVQEFSRPVLIMEADGDELKGSARSIDGFNIVEALAKCSEYLIQFGGHAQAAGFKLKKEHFLLLDEKLISISDKEIETINLVPELIIDNMLLFKNIDQELVDSLTDLEPYGTDNFKPVFASEQVRINQNLLVGKNKEHLKLVLSDGNIDLNGIAFQYGQICKLKKSDMIDLAYTIEINEWKQQKKIDLHIIDIKVSHD